MDTSDCCESLRRDKDFFDFKCANYYDNRTCCQYYRECTKVRRESLFDIPVDVIIRVIVGSVCIIVLVYLIWGFCKILLAPPDEEIEAYVCFKFC